MCCGFGGLKSRLAKAAGAMKNCTQLWREASFQVRMSKAPQCRSTFGSWAVETVQMIVARSTCQSQNVQNTPYPEHFWKIRCWKVHGVVARSTLRCWKSARRCGTKHMSKSKVAKTGGLGALFEVKMSKKCTPVWREAHVEVEMFKSHHTQTTFGRSQHDDNNYSYIYNYYNYHFSTLHYTGLHHNYNYNYNYSYNYSYNRTTLHYTTLIARHYTTLNYTNYTTLHYHYHDDDDNNYY